MKKIGVILLFFILVVHAYAQDPVTWTFKLQKTGSDQVQLTANAQIQSGWHIYDVKIPDGGPNPTSLSFDELKGAVKVGSFKTINSKLHKAYDPLFEMQVGSYTGNATFIQVLKVTDQNLFSVKGDIRAQSCDDGECRPPIPIEFSFTSKDLPSDLVVSASSPKGLKTETKAASEDVINQVQDTPSSLQNNQVQPTSTNSSTLKSVDSDLWRPVIKELQKYGAAGSIAHKSLLWIFISGFIGGLIALLTPCVWPMIPMTVSFFLKRNKKDRRKSIRDALTYGLSIIIIYVLLGLIITLIFGAGALNRLSTSALFNLFFFALILVFSISFLGAFEIVLPSSWTNKMDSKADSTTGLLSIFFMAFTLSLVSFSCTGPIIGTLLVQAASSGAILSPVLGMFGFALALSIPFAVFALFPSLLGSMPKSGGWLNSVKVVLGFLELALALKFLSVADLAYGWRILDREVFLVLWIVIFALLGFYLLGKLKFPHDSETKHVSIPRLILAIISLAFALYLVPGLWGAPLKSISAFSPPIWTQDFSLYKGTVHAKYDDYESGMEYAKRVNKPVIIDFSGFGCVNCRKMEASVWTDARVKKILEDDYVLISLMVDDKTKLPKEISVEENGKTTKIKTIGDKWSYLERHKFGTSSQPYYVLIDHDGNPIGPSYAFDQDVSKYLKFLNEGLSNFNKKR